MKQQNSRVSRLTYLSSFPSLPFLGISSSSSPKTSLELDAVEKEVIMANDVVFAQSSKRFKDDMELQLTGLELEDCREKDEECNSTRIIWEAHLDYIYTQHHKPGVRVIMKQCKSNI